MQGLTPQAPRHGWTTEGETTTPARLILVSNRLPVTIRSAADNGFSVERSSGGLATALSHPHTERDSLWIGWPGGVFETDEEQQQIAHLLRTEHRFLPVFLSADDISSYYDGFSNRALWPLCHFFEAHVVYDDEEWDAYVRVNRFFCETILREARGDEVIWVHDYHLFLLPSMLRQQAPEARIGFFLHTPFPPAELFRVLPCREALLRGLLGADLIGFQTFGYMQNFLGAVYRVLGIDADKGSLSYEGRHVQSAIHPISVDPEQFLQALQTDPETASELQRLDKGLGDRKLLLGMDRLDYSKGIPGRLRAYQRFLANYPEWRERVTFVQVAVPSREQVPAYQELRRQVDELVGEINGAYGTTVWSPVQYIYRNLPFSQIVALMRRADVALVTPLRDGMNLVAKEYVVCQGQRAGALILSEFAGASSEMGEAFFVNPYDIEGMTVRLVEVLTSPEDVLAERMHALHARICTHTVHDWARKFLETLDRIPRQQTTRVLTPGERQRLCAAYAQAKHRMLLLGYDGTLTPLVPLRDRALPSMQVLHTLQHLQQDTRNVVTIISGRDRVTLERWLGACGIVLVAEHGAWIRERRDGPWRQTHPELHDDWKATVRPILEQVVEKTPGSSIEEKDYSVVWHYRMADPEFGLWQANELYSQLQSLLAGSGLQVQGGHKIVETKWAEVQKGVVAAQMIAEAEPVDFILAIGDDRTDEDIFEVVPPEQWTVKVGTGFSAARFSLQTPAEVLALLHDLMSASSS